MATETHVPRSGQLTPRQRAAFPCSMLVVSGNLHARKQAAAPEAEIKTKLSSHRVGTGSLSY